MRRFAAVVAFAALSAIPALAQLAKPATATNQPLVEFEMMTWPEVRDALAAGKTTALVYTGGTEQRGPQNVNGGHTLMGRETVKAIALKLGNAIALPVLPYTPNNASAQLPGTIGLTPDLLSAILERITDQAVTTGFKNVILMGDHGGGQPNAYRDVAKTLDDKYSPQGVHVYYCDEVYSKANGDFDEYLKSKGLPFGGHASIIDTSEMLYLGGDKGWVRKDLIKTAVGDPVPQRSSTGSGQAGESGGRGERGRGRGQTDPNAPPRINNGITGDARPSTAELGKYLFDLKVDYAVRQIQQLVGSKGSE